MAKSRKEPLDGDLEMVPFEDEEDHDSDPIDGDPPKERKSKKQTEKSEEDEESDSSDDIIQIEGELLDENSEEYFFEALNSTEPIWISKSLIVDLDRTSEDDPLVTISISQEKAEELGIY